MAPLRGSPLPPAALALVAGLLLTDETVAACLLVPLLLVDARFPEARATTRALLLGLLLGRAGAGATGIGLPPEGSTVTVLEGVVTRAEPPAVEGTRFLLDVETAGEGTGAQAWRARVDVHVVGAAPPLRPGDRVRTPARLRPVPGPRNPGAPDPRRWARVNGVEAWARVEDARGIERVAASTGLPAAIAAARADASAALGTCLGPEDAGLARALLLGDRGGLTDHDRERFRAAGQAHLVAVSGQHVALVLAAVLLVLRRLGARTRLASVLGLLAVALYVPLTGSPPSAVRSGVGASLWLLGRLLAREPSGLPMLAAAALAMLAVAPNDLLDPGFTLSFGAVLGIELLAPRFTALLVPEAPVLPGLLPRKPARLRRMLAVALAAWLGSAGLALFLLGQVSFAAAPLSVPAVPLTAALLAFAALAVVFAPIALLAAVPAWLFAKTADLLRALLDVPPALGLETVTVRAPGAAWLAASAALLLVLGLGPARFFRWALLAQALLFAAALAPPAPPMPAYPVVIALDAGRAPAVVVLLPDGRSALLDAGSRADEAARRVVVPALRQLGVSRLDVALVTSAERPRTDALATVLAEVSAARVFETLEPGVLLEGRWGRLEVLAADPLVIQLVTAEGQTLLWTTEREAEGIDGAVTTELRPEGPVVSGTMDAEPSGKAVVRDPYHPRAMLPALSTSALAWTAVGLAAFAILSVRPLKWLRPGGAAAAWVLGLIVAGTYGWPGFAALFGTFVVATLLGKLPGAARDRGRTFRQVVANGLPAAVGAAITWLPDAGGAGGAFFLGALACLGADTCATEIGVRYGGTPRSLLTGRTVVPGESGGVTVAGLVASALGGAVPVIALFAVEGLLSADEHPSRGVVLTLVALYAAVGLVGSLLDSVLGATLQYRGRDPATGLITEKRRVDGRPTECVSGWRWLDNDAVNLVTGLAAGGLVIGLLHLFS